MKKKSEYAVLVDPDTRRGLKVMAAERDISIKELIKNLLEKELKKEERDEPK